eukprot:6492670-Amphidinium_carterae.1
MSISRLREPVLLLAGLLTMLVFTLAAISVAAVTLYNSLELHAAHSLPLPLGTEPYMVADDLTVQFANFGNFLAPLLVSVPEKTFEELQVVHLQSSLSSDRWCVADGLAPVLVQDYTVGGTVIKDCVVCALVQSTCQESDPDMSVLQFDLLLDAHFFDQCSSGTEATVVPDFQCVRCMDVYHNGTTDVLLLQLVSMHAGLDVNGAFLILANASDHAVNLDVDGMVQRNDLSSAYKSVPVIAGDFVLGIHLLLVGHLVHGDDLAIQHSCEGLVSSESLFQPSKVFVHSSVVLSDVDPHCATSIDKLLTWLMSGTLLKDFLLLSTWASQALVWLLSMKRFAWTLVVGFAQIYLVAPKWQVGKHPVSGKARRSCQRCLYSPGSELQGDCFFACVAFAITGSPPSKSQVRSVRLATAALWKLAPTSMLDKTAARAGYASADDYVHAIQGSAWGGLPDLLIWTQLLGLSATVVVGNEQHSVGNGGLHLELSDNHFVVTRSTSSCKWRKITGIVSRKAPKILKYLEWRASTAPAPATYRVSYLDKAGQVTDSELTPSAYCFCRGGMRRVAAPDPDDEETIAQRAQLATLRTHNPAGYLRDLRVVCSAITQVLGVTVGHFFVPHAPSIEFATTRTSRLTRPLTIFWLEDIDASGIVLDALLRLAFLFGYVVQYVSLEPVPPPPDAWMWPMPPNPFTTAWAAHSTTHVIIIESDLRAMLIISRFDYDLLLTDAPADLRGGDPVLGIQLRSAPRWSRVLFQVPFLNVRWEDYAIALELARLAISGVALSAVILRFGRDHVVCCNSGGCYAASRHTIIRIPQSIAVRVVLLDILVRAVFGLHWGLLHMSFGDRDNRPHLLAGQSRFLESFTTSWMSSVTNFVVLVDTLKGDLFVLYAKVPALVMDSTLIHRTFVSSYLDDIVVITSSHRSAGNLRGGAKRGRDSNPLQGERYKVVLSYHGTFSPFHPGHAEVIRCARQLALQQGLEVVDTVIGFTKESYAARKLHSSTWTNLPLRAAMAKAVIADIGLTGVTIDSAGHRTSYDLAMQHSTPSVFPVYLAGSDTIPRPESSTITVLRNSLETTRSHFDHRKWTGVCSQEHMVGLSSTIVREWHAKGRVPSVYGAQARKVLQTLRNQPLQVAQFTYTPDAPDVDADPKASSRPVYLKGRATPWTPDQQLATYGTGFTILEKMGHQSSAADTPPVIGVARRKKVGLQENESLVIDRQLTKHLDVRPPPLSATRLTNTSAASSTQPAVAQRPADLVPCVEPAPAPPRSKAMPRKRVMPKQAPVPPPLVQPLAEGQMAPPPIPQVIDVESERVQIIEVAQSIAAISSDSEDEDASTSAPIQRIPAESDDEFRLRHLSACMTWAKTGQHRDPHYLQQCPWLQESIRDLARRSTRGLEEVHFQELHTALTLMPWKALTVCWADPVYARMLAKRIRAELETFHRADALARGQLTLTRWIFLLLRDLAADNETKFHVATDWVQAEHMTLIILGGSLTLEELYYSALVGHSRAVCSASNLVALMDGLLLQYAPRLLSGDGTHQLGCTCQTRSFLVEVRLHFPTVPGWRTADLVKYVLPPLELLWNLKSSTLSMERGTATLNARGTRDPPCLLPVVSLSDRAGPVALSILEYLGHEVLYFEHHEVPFQRLHGDDALSLSNIRRRALTFPDVIGVITVHNECAFVCRNHRSRPQTTSRFPRLLEGDGFENLTFPCATLDEAVAMTAHIVGGSCPKLSRSHSVNRFIASHLVIDPNMDFVGYLYHDGVGIVIACAILLGSAACLPLIGVVVGLLFTKGSHDYFDRNVYSVALEHNHESVVTSPLLLLDAEAHPDGLLLQVVNIDPRYVKCDLLGLRQHFPQCRGGMPSSSSADPSPDLVLQTERKRKRRVTIYLEDHFAPSHVVFVDSNLSLDSVLRLLPGHFAAHRTWLRLTCNADSPWVIYAQFICPIPRHTDWVHLIAISLYLLAGKNQAFLGYRATRAHGMSTPTAANSEMVLALNQWAALWLPWGFAWNAIAILSYRDVELHTDRFNNDCSIAISLLRVCSTLVFHSGLAQALTQVSLARRPGCFNPLSQHGASAPSATITLVFYHTSRLARAEHIGNLRELGFRCLLPSTFMNAQIAESSPLSDTADRYPEPTEDSPAEGCATMNYDSDARPLSELAPRRSTDGEHAGPVAISPTLSFHDTQLR